MDRKLLGVVCALGAGLLAQPVQAQETGQGGQVVLGATAGTLGIGPEVGYRFSPLFGVRANAGWFHWDEDFDIDDVDYNGKLKLNSYGLMADVYPFRGKFRVSVGARLNDNHVRLRATPGEPVTIGNDVYTPEEIGTLRGNIETNRIAPMVTIGYAGRLATGWAFAIEAGALFHGSPEVGALTANGFLADHPEFQQDLRREIDEIEDEADDYKVWPVLQLSVSYRF
ncbi:hypothetical protein [Pedomonas mirosovicensis]|uniref:hypothetical protein n=1 Tax=Pedomonas mirosovicensis TaxID=2908641 RepID=UPI002168D05D|nr:hypothetical protein [Pedomonas mirosovicensis]MCH8684725.1 hypothetical protein [Pedomonas mirosovicensis]